MEIKKIGLKHQLSYGSVNLLGSGSLAMAQTWLLIFYTTVVGIEAWKAALIFTIATNLDVVTNPIMGYISDNFYRYKIGRRFGRRRFFLLIGIPLIVLYPLVYIPLPGGIPTDAKWIFYLVTYILFECVYTMIMIPYEALAPEMTDNFADRATLTGTKAIFGKLANFLSQIIPAFFFWQLGENNEWAFALTGISFGIIMMVSVFALYRNSWERSPEEVHEPQAGSMFENLKKLFIDVFSTLRVKAFRTQLGMYLFGFGAEWLWASTFTFFVVYILGIAKSGVALFNSWSSILQIVSTFIVMFWVAKKGYRRPMQASLVIVILSVLAYCFVYLTGLTSVGTVGVYAIVMGITIFFGIGTGGVYYVPWSTYTFMADIDEALTGRHRAGVYAGAMTMVGKLVRAWLVMGLGIALSAFGFNAATETQPQSALNAIIGVAFVVCIMALIGVFFAQKMKLDNNIHQQLLFEINRRKEGGLAEDVTPEHRKVVEDLTGWKYEDCFGNNNVGYKSHEDQD
ncbi:MAG: MFS transporter [Lactobacillaceae bacterium]|nr:MFS transporter [Lactobacillaceae bacterium]